MKRASSLAICLGLAFVFGQSLIYEPYVVPHLASWQSVPFAWWLAAFAPELAVVATAAFILRGAKSGAIFCAFGALCVTIAQWLFTALPRPGASKVIEGGGIHFLVQFLTLAAIVTVVYACLSLLHIAWRKVGAG